MKMLKNNKYLLCFYPIAGLLIGAFMYAWGDICLACGFGQVCFALVGAVIPVLLTRGLYLEGFMNSFALLRSGLGKEKRHEVTDSHIRAFSVIMLVCYFLLYAAGLHLIWKERQLLLLGLCFIVSRTLSGMAMAWFQREKRDGALFSFSSAAQKQTVRIVLVLILALCFIGGVAVHPVLGAVTALADMWVWTYYYYLSKNRFGGITGELSGYFICLCELSGVLVIGFLGRILL